MSQFNPTSKKDAEEFQVPQVRFLGEQDGAPERELKCRLAQFFQSDQSITTAYLARVAYGDECFAVALCLRAQLGPDRDLAGKVGKIFASLFGGHEHLDIIFLSKIQEAELVSVCKPFFATGEKEPEDGEENQI
jgi:SseB protein C-terminal domain